MAHNDKKILQVLIGELGDIPERCDGYRDELMHLLGDVLNMERAHAIARTNVVKQIADQVNTVGMFLHRTRSNGESERSDR